MRAFLKVGTGGRIGFDTHRQVLHLRQPIDCKAYEKNMNEYKLTFTVTIEEQDDPAARKHAMGIIESLGEVVSDADVKLQQVHQDKPPRGVRIS